jgi:D-alanyl-D-alanine carboxypeptidase (penicillin-binding protein 5/6)
LPVTHGVSAKIRVRPVSEAPFVIPKGSASRVEYHYSLPENVAAPIKRGQKVGKVQATLDGELVYQSDIVSYDEVEELTFLKSLELMFKALLAM